MSTNICWKCGAAGHNNRQCTSTAQKDSSILVKKAVQSSHNMFMKKTTAENEKWMEKLRIREMPIYPRDILRKQCDAEIDVVYFVESKLNAIGALNIDHNTEQMKEAKESEELLKSRLPEMRDIVAHCKNYIYRWLRSKEWDAEDEMFKLTVEYLDEARKPLLSKCGQIIANLVDIALRKPVIGQKINVASHILRRCEAHLGESSPSTSTLEAVLEQLVSVRETVGFLDEQMKHLHEICELGGTGESVSEIRKRFQLCWDLRNRKLQDEMDSLQNTILCTICYDNKKEYVLKCGHLFCYRCIQQLNPTGVPPKQRCPYCKKNLELLVKVFLN